MEDSTMPRQRSHWGIDFTPTIHRDTYPLISPLSHNLAGRTVLVTGASKGIGRAICLSYARAGASQLAIGARSPLDAVASEIKAVAREAGRPEPQVLPLQLDIADEQSVEAARDAVTKAFGRLDVLLNNAGYLEPFVRITDSAPDEWWHSMTVNIKGTYLMNRAFIPLLLSSRDGLKTLLNFSSIGAHTVVPGAFGYQGAKLWIMRLGEYLMKEYGDEGLLAYAVHPGSVPTDLALRMPKERHDVLVDKVEVGSDSIVWLTAKRREWLAARWVSVNWDMAELEGMQQEIVEKDLLKLRMIV